MPGPNASLNDEKAPQDSSIETEFNRQAVQEALESILATPLFRSSRNYTAFLRFVVDRRLEGRTEDLKERSLGVDVFGRRFRGETRAETDL